MRNLVLIFTLIFQAVQSYGNQALMGKLIDTNRIVKNIWIDGKHCNNPRGSCDAILFDEVTLKTEQGLQKIKNLVLMNKFLVECRSFEANGWGLKALIYAFSDRQFWVKEDQSNIKKIEVSDLTVMLKGNLEDMLSTSSPNKNNVKGIGYFGKMQIQIDFEKPIKESIEELSMCQREEEGEVEVQSKTLIYGE